jgi:anti-anti-sigma factor
VPDPGAAGPQPFSVEVIRPGLTARVVVAGELDLLTAPRLQAVLDKLVAAGDMRHLVLDLRKLEFIDSTGVAMIYSLEQLARQDGFDAAFVRGPLVQRVLTISGLAGRLVMVDSPDELALPD